LAGGSAAILTGDFDQMLARRLIRVGVPYSRTHYYNDRGRERGITAEAMRDFEQWLNRRHARQLARRPLTLVMLPTTRDTLIDDLAAGRTDLAAGNLTVTPARLAQVDFFSPTDRPPGRELIAAGPSSPQRDVAAGSRRQDRACTRQHQLRRHPGHWSARFAQAGMAPIEVAPLPDDMEDEDVLELVAAGALDFCVVDEWKGRIWARALPELVLRTDLVLRDDVRAGWAMRHGSPLLMAEVDVFYRQYVKKHHLIEIRLADALRRAERLRNPASGAEHQRFAGHVALFEKYGERYGFDPLLLLAQGYQESGLRQDAVSSAGAIGLMQLLPATGAAMKVGDIRQTEANVHAAVRYMDKLMTRYLGDAPLSRQQRTLFALASYNAGPGRIAGLRKLAGERGIDPNTWFGQVERLAAERIGLETTTYVRNIYKYYVAYTLMNETRGAPARHARAGRGQRKGT
jgi:membrane-bound lytic murein transglycosylase MltF